MENGKLVRVESEFEKKVDKCGVASLFEGGGPKGLQGGVEVRPIF